MAGIIARETMRLTGGRQRPYQNGSIVSELYYSLTPGTAVSTVAAKDLNAAPEETALNSGTSRQAPSENMSITPDMVPIGGGTFTMGSPSMELDRVGFRELQHQVQLSAFQLGAKEVTVAEFRRFVQDTAYKTSAELAGGSVCFNENAPTAVEGRWEMREGADWRRPGFT
jgi:formylglycine-generating enzyme required for sulfatase activity